ncbi:MAG: SOS response-associated peptidase family protein [Clostridia bacterium]|nr:SOS response-associated peptidase family protein [Clostridia bacterium]
MCGRYYVSDDERLSDMVKRMNRTGSLAVKTGEIRPKDTAPVCVYDGKPVFAARVWGLRGKDGRLIINARSESAAEKPLFRELFAGSRIVVPANAYYEWDSAKMRHTYAHAAGRMYLAGLQKGGEFVILTRGAYGSLASVHPRMPVVFTRQAALAWLSPASDPARVLGFAETGAIFEKPDAPLQLRLDL